MDLPQAGIILEARVARAQLPNGHAVAIVAWPETGAESSIHMLPGHWTAGDATKATAALRWLETLPGPRGGGRRRLEASPSHSWRHLADQAIEMQCAEPFLSLDIIVQRLGMTDEDGRDRTRTLRRWIDRRKADSSEN